ncbi:MAG: DUF1385 domain-containing protein [Synergistaceae bacterium]|nr:DUF1385 domain-containing protein [Synergistaceae bacterium]
MNRICRIPIFLMNMLISTLMSAKVDESKRIPVGGQAVIEGVLMKGPKHWGLVVRRQDGTLWSKAWFESGWLKKGVWKFPIIRGFASMAEMMRIGFRALSISAEQALGEEENFTVLEMTLTVIFAIAMVAGLFIALPVWISDRLVHYASLSSVAKNIAEGAVRGLVFVGYVAIVGLWKDIRRVFAYHGAEHKTINAYENDVPLNTTDVAACSRIHRRCGTSFIIIVVVVSIVVFSFFGQGPIWRKVAARILLLPLVIGISYEVIKGASKSETWGKYLIMPALSLQFLTTREPDESMLEVAIKSLNVALDPNAALTANDEVKEEDGTLEQT